MSEKKTQAAEAPKTNDTKTQTNDTTTSADATKLPVSSESEVSAVATDTTNSTLQPASEPIKDTKVDALVDLVKSSSKEEADAALLKMKEAPKETVKEETKNYPKEKVASKAEITSEVASIIKPTPGHMVTYSPELSEAIYSNAAQTWPAVIVYVDDLTVDLVVFSSNPRTPTVSRTNVPHASIAKDRPSWDWPVIKK